MYAVIFKAEINELDEDYQARAARLREIAINRYGCSEFVASTEGDFEIAISYWPGLDNISAWKLDPEHREAQALGKLKWYKTYRVQVVEVLREYEA